MDGVLIGAGALVAVDDAEDLFAHGDEVRTGFDATSIAGLQEAPVEVRREGVVMRPGRGDMTISRELRNSASSTLCVMKKNIFPVSRQMSSSNSWMVSRVSASSAAMGSSISSMAGSQVSARAMPTRCCMPPESW